MPVPAVSPPVVRSLYRSLLREVRKLDNSVVTKVMFPLPKTLQAVANTHCPLYIPNGKKYSDVVRATFKKTEGANLNLAFDALHRLRRHNEEVLEKMPLIVKDRSPLMAAMKGAASEAYFASSIPIAEEPTLRVGQRDKENKLRATEIVVKKSRTFDVQVGMGLIAHPLSSAHVDRRVMLVVEKTPVATTALVLDMLYSYPLSQGNPVFPEVFWGHDVYNGGYSHVDFTMPPTAHVSVLHTLSPPSVSKVSADTTAWFQWARQAAVGGKAANSKPLDPPEQLCTPVIPGRTVNGVDIPTLYYSRVEALPYLAQLAPGHPRSSVKVFWGCMKWPTSQICQEVANGHWIPVNLSPQFFCAYPLVPPSGKKKAVTTIDQRFPTVAELEEARQSRLRHLGADVVPPQVFPPDQPLCRRETLWDQILYAMGGEFTELVGCANPFTSPQDAARIRSMDHIVDEIRKQLPDADEDDDDEDGDDGNPAP